MELDQELEQDLTFRRFSPDKQDQIRHLVSYTTLLGLTGKDLISIGGRLERIEKIKVLKSNRTIAAQYMGQIQELWSNSRSYGRRFKYHLRSGKEYQIETDHWMGIKVTNLTNKKEKKIVMQDYEVGKGYKSIMYIIALNIHYGHIEFDF